MTTILTTILFLLAAPAAAEAHSATLVHAHASDVIVPMLWCLVGALAIAAIIRDGVRR